MAPEMSGNDRLNSWKEIAAYVGRDVRTVIRWEQRAGLPIHRIPVGQRQAVYAHRSEIDAWMRQGSKAAPAITTDPPPETEASPATVSIPAAEPSIPRSAVVPTGRLRPQRHLWLWGFLVLFIATALFVLHSSTTSKSLQFNNLTQITKDGVEKQGLITDGKTLYFGELRNARTELAAVSVNGGPIRLIPTPLVNATPTDISPDGKNLLVLDAEGEEHERQLWIVPVDGHPPLRVGTILCHFAAWSPDGRHIAFAYRNGVALTNVQGTDVRLLQSFPQIPAVLRWTRDGSGLRLTLLDPTTGRSALWQIALSTDSNPVVLSVAPLGIAIDDCCADLSRQDREGGSFLSSGSLLTDNRILYLAPGSALHPGAVRLVEMNRLLGSVQDLSLDPTGKRLFAESDSADPADTTPLVWTNLVAFNMASHVFRPFLPGVAAEDLDFSRDGKQMAWINPADQSVWVSRSDGGEARRLAIGDSNNELPRWSPDGQQLAFMAKFSGRPWRIYITSADGASFREASVGTDNQGAPTWSPDGTRLAYGNVLCEEANSCAIHEVDLATGRESTLPDSQGMETARWSPDGRFIAALQPETRRVFLFDLRASRWQELADGINGNNLRWSLDSRYLYASNPSGDKPDIVRISAKTGAVVPAVDLYDFTRLAGRVDPWFTLTPDGSIIFVRRQQPIDIFALSFQ